MSFCHTFTSYNSFSTRKNALQNILAVVAASATLSLATPIPENEKIQKHFTIEHRGTGRFVPKNGALERQKVFMKYGVPVPHHVAAAAKRELPDWYVGLGGDGKVPAVASSWTEKYTCPVQIGTPPQTMHLDLDTGSADFVSISGFPNVLMLLR